MVAWEEDMEDVVSAHEGRGKQLALLMKSKGMEGKINIYVDVDIRKSTIIYANKNKGSYLEQDQR
jgi:hypothetical protein